MLTKMWKQGVKYMAKHPWQNMFAHLLTGFGFGILLARPMAQDHPIRWGVALLTVSLAWHLYSMLKR